MAAKARMMIMMIIMIMMMIVMSVCVSERVSGGNIALHPIRVKKKERKIWDNLIKQQLNNKQGFILLTSIFFVRKSG